MIQAELAPARYRGGLAGLQQFMLSWGYFAAQWIGYGSSFSKTTFQWRFPLCMASVRVEICKFSKLII